MLGFGVWGDLYDISIRKEVSMVRGRDDWLDIYHSEYESGNLLLRYSSIFRIDFCCIGISNLLARAYVETAMNGIEVEPDQPRMVVPVPIRPVAIGESCLMQANTLLREPSTESHSLS